MANISQIFFEINNNTKDICLNPYGSSLFAPTLAKATPKPFQEIPNVFKFHFLNKSVDT